MRSLAIFALLAISAYATIIDQIAVTVGNEAITATAIIHEIRLSSLLNKTVPDFGDASRRAAADRLIQQTLIRREMTFGSYPPASQEQIDTAHQDTTKSHGGESGLAHDLEQAGLSVKDLRDYLKWQIELLRFIDLRFRPSVQVSRQDVRKYYDQTFKAREGAKAPDLIDVRAEIEAKLTGERVDQQLDQWMKDQRSRTAIRYLDSTLGKSTLGKSTLGKSTLGKSRLGLTGGAAANSVTRGRLTTPRGR